MSIISVKNLNFAYKKEKILNNINLDIKQGKIIGILGSNGSGKSTFLKCLSGILKCKNADIKINNYDINKIKISKHIAYVAQHTNINFSFNVFEIVSMGINPGRFNAIFGIKKQDKDFILQTLKEVNMQGFENVNFNDLSGGYKQLALIARALVMKTPILLLDEPTSALDFKNQILILKIIKKLSNEGKSILICTHEPNHIMWFCDEVIVFKDSQALFYGDTKTVLKQKTLDLIYGKNFSLSYIQNTNMKIIYPNL